MEIYSKKVSVHNNLIHSVLYFVVASRQKVGIILENKGFKELKLSKNVNNKKCAPKMTLFNILKDSHHFLH